MVPPETDTTHIGQQTHVLSSIRVCQASAFVPRKTEATPFVAPTLMGDEMPEETENIDQHFLEDVYPN